MRFGTSPTPSRTRSEFVARLRWAVPTVILGVAVAATVAPAAAYADTTSPVGAPAAPASVTVAEQAGSLAIDWSPPSDDGTSALTGYDVAAVPADPANGNAPATAVTDPATTTTTLSGLANGVDYVVTVAATNAVGTGPAATADATPRTVPTAVVVTGVSAADATATVTWQPPTSDGGAAVASYVVTAQPSGVTTTVAADATTATVGGLADGSTTTLSVSAVNIAGSGPAATTTAVTPRKPGALRVAVSPASAVAYGTATHVTASITDTSGHPISARRVVLYYRVGTGAFHAAAAGLTGSTGRVTLSTVLPANSTLVLQHFADAVDGLRITAGSVRVAHRLTESTPKPILAGQYVTTTGSVAPARGIGAPVQLKRLVGTSWVTVANGKMVTRTSYRVSWKVASAGTYGLRVVIPSDASYIAGWGRAWRQTVSVETVRSVAGDILRNTRITLATTHESGVRDGATAEDDMLALAGGHWAPRSAYQNAPGGSTPVDIRLLRALRALGGKARVTVSEIAGGSHAVGSSHYRGEAMDIAAVNGVSIAAGGNYSLVASVCRSYGASAVYDPAYDPYGGHGNHVHCQWGALSSD